MCLFEMYFVFESTVMYLFTTIHHPESAYLSSFYYNVRQTAAKPHEEYRVMQVLSNKIPTMDGFKRTKNADIKKLESKITTIRRLAETENPKVPASLRLDTNDMECLIRLFKTLDYSDFCEDKFTAEVKASPYFTIMGRWFAILANMNYSNFISFKQYQHPRYNAATSLPMLAAREKNELPYIKWKNTVNADYLFSKIITKALYAAPPAEEYQKIKFSSDLISAAKPRGDLQTYTLSYVGTRFEGEDEDGEIYLWEGFDAWPPVIKHMKLQTWIFHPKFRSPSMLLDPYDWDLVPPSHYGEVEQEITPTNPKLDLML